MEEKSIWRQKSGRATMLVHWAQQWAGYCPPCPPLPIISCRVVIKPELDLQLAL